MRLIGMLCCTERGIFTFTRSLLFAAARDLIKIATPLSVKAVIENVFSDVFPVARKQKLCLDDRPKELLKGHPVIREKARHCSGRGQHTTEPACGFLADYAAQEKIHPGSDGNGEDCAGELPGRQAEEDTLFILPDLFWNLYFDRLCTSFGL